MEKIRVYYYDEVLKQYYLLSLEDNIVTYETGIKALVKHDTFIRYEYFYDSKNVIGDLNRIMLHWILLPRWFNYRDGLFVEVKLKEGEELEVWTTEEIEEILRCMEFPIKLWNIDDKIQAMFLEELKKRGYKVQGRGSSSL